MLHAATLELRHPLTGQPLRVSAPLPDDFRKEAEHRGLCHFEAGITVNAATIG